MGQGYVWQDLQVGQRLHTFRRTVTETVQVKHGRAVVISRIDVYNQRGTPVMTDTATRLLAGRNAPAA